MLWDYEGFGKCFIEGWLTAEIESLHSGQCNANTRSEWQESVVFFLRVVVLLALIFLPEELQPTLLLVS